MYNVEPTCQIPTINEIYIGHFGLKKNGVFVEVGAFDGQTHSNTCFLADMGWKGLYIEPIEEYAELCKRRHAANVGVKVMHYAVSDRVGIAEFKVAGELSTTIDDPAALYKSAGLEILYTGENEHKTETSLQVTLDILLAYGNIKPGFDLLVIDTESTELEVLKGFSISRYKPKMVIVEMHELSDEWQRIASVKETNEKIHAYFKKNKYTSVYKDDINTIFVKS